MERWKGTNGLSGIGARFFLVFLEDWAAEAGRSARRGGVGEGAGEDADEVGDVEEERGGELEDEEEEDDDDEEGERQEMMGTGEAREVREEERGESEPE